MKLKYIYIAVLVFVFAPAGWAEEKSAEAPTELEVIRDSIGIWDAEFEVWAQGPEAPPMKFSGVETNTAYGNYWMASDLVSTFNGRSATVHSIVGYDKDLKKLTGLVIDHGPYSARMTGEYNPKENRITWTTHGKMPDGSPILQKTVVTHKSPEERILELAVPGKNNAGFVTFMKIRYTKRK